MSRVCSFPPVLVWSASRKRENKQCAAARRAIQLWTEALHPGRHGDILFSIDTIKVTGLNGRRDVDPVSLARDNENHSHNKSWVPPPNEYEIRPRVPAPHVQRSFRSTAERRHVIGDYGRH